MIPGLKPSTCRTTPDATARTVDGTTFPTTTSWTVATDDRQTHASAPRRNVPHSHRLNRRSGDGPPHSTPASRVTTHVNVHRTRPAAGGARARARASRHFDLRTSCLRTRDNSRSEVRSNERQANERTMGTIQSATRRMTALNEQTIVRTNTCMRRVCKTVYSTVHHLQPCGGARLA